MKATRLYCQGACAACSTLARSLTDAGVNLEIYDVVIDPHAYDTVISLGYRSLPVLVSPEGISAVGASTSELAHRLTSQAKAPAETNLDSETQVLTDKNGKGQHAHDLVSEVYWPEVISRKDKS